MSQLRSYGYRRAKWGDSSKMFFGTTRVMPYSFWLACPIGYIYHSHAPVMDGPIRAVFITGQEESLHMMGGV